MKRTWLLLAVGFSGCATQSLQVTSLAYSPDTMELIGPVTGQVSMEYALCIPFTNSDDSLTAISRALKPSSADALLNPAVETEYFFLAPFYCRKQVTVSGIAVKFKHPGMPGESKTFPLGNAH